MWASLGRLFLIKQFRRAIKSRATRWVNLFPEMFFYDLRGAPACRNSIYTSSSSLNHLGMHKAHAPRTFSLRLNFIIRSVYLSPARLDLSISTVCFVARLTEKECRKKSDARASPHICMRSAKAVRALTNDIAMILFSQIWFRFNSRQHKAFFMAL